MIAARQLWAGLFAQPSKSEAQRWLEVSQPHTIPNLPMVRNVHVRRLLDQAALASFDAGLDGRLWLFEDASRIVANDQGVRVI